MGISGNVSCLPHDFQEPFFVIAVFIEILKQKWSREKGLTDGKLQLNTLSSFKNILKSNLFVYFYSLSFWQSTFPLESKEKDDFCGKINETLFFVFFLRKKRLGEKVKLFRY